LQIISKNITLRLITYTDVMMGKSIKYYFLREENNLVQVFQNRF